MDVTLGLGSAIGGIFGAASSAYAAKKNLQAQRETNAMNWQIAQLNNDYNARMFDQQMQHDFEMWDKQVAYNNEMLDYNKPVNQAARMREAGLNPYMSGIEAGQGSTSTPQALGVNPPTASPVSMQAPQLDLSGFSSAIQQTMSNLIQLDMQESQKRKLDAEAKTSEIMNQTLGARNLAELNKLKADVRGSNAKADLDITMNNLRKATFSDDVNKARFESLNSDLQGQYIRAQTSYMNMQANLADSQNKELQKKIGYMDEQNKMQLSLLASQIALNGAKKKESYQAVRESIARAYLANRQAMNLPYMNMQDATILAGALVDKAEYESEHYRLSNTSLEKTIRQQGADYWNPLRYLGNLLGPAATIGAKLIK